jgi:hypothetical protein
MYDIEFDETMMIFIEMNLCLNVLSTSMIMIAEIVFELSIKSTTMRNDLISLSSSMTNSLIDVLSNVISKLMFNSSKNWMMKFSSWLSSNSMINCFKWCSNLWRDFYIRLRFAKRFLKSSRFFLVWFVHQQLSLSHTKHFFETRIENLSRDRELIRNLRLSRLLNDSNSRWYCLSIKLWSWKWSWIQSMMQMLWKYVLLFLLIDS